MSHQHVNYSRPYINRQDGGRGKEEDTHHILARSMGGTNHKDNKINLYIDLHTALHRVFGNGTPINQLHQLLKINDKALTQEFKHDLIKVLQEDDPLYYYKNGIYVKR